MVLKDKTDLAVPEFSERAGREHERIAPVERDRAGRRRLEGTQRVEQ